VTQRGARGSEKDELFGSSAVHKNAAIMRNGLHTKTKKFWLPIKYLEDLEKKG